MRTLILLALVAMCFGCESKEQPTQPVAETPVVTETESITAEKVVDEFEGYRLMTAEPVDIDVVFAMLCGGGDYVDKMMEEDLAKYGPHAFHYLLIYMNDKAAGAFRGKETPYPVGSVIVKKKTNGGYSVAKEEKKAKQPYGLGGMIKRPAGYDPEHGDWEYFYFEKPSPIQTGKIASCIECHAKAKDRDYVYGDWKSPK